MSNRRRPRSERRLGGVETSFSMTRLTSGTPADLGGFNQMARRSCDECGAAVEWVTGAEAEARGLDLFGGMEMLGVDAIPGKDVWVCTGCDNFGIMGPAEGGFF